MSSELKKATGQLSKENRRILRKMRHYLEACYLNEVVFEETMSDLVGMALESQQRGEALDAVIGMDYRDFCRELARNAQKQSWLERILNVLLWLMWCGLLIVPALYVVSLSRIFHTAYGENGVLNAPIPFVLKYFAVSAVIIVGWFMLRRFTYFSQTLVMSVYVCVVMAIYILMDVFAIRFLGSWIVHISLLRWIAVFAFLILLCHGVKRLTALTIAYRNQKKKKRL